MKELFEQRKGRVLVKGNYLKWYSEDDDAIYDCPYIDFLNMIILAIDDEEIFLEATGEDYYVKLKDIIGNIEEEIGGGIYG